MEQPKTKENQNQIQYDTYQQLGPVTLGPWTSHIYRSDPRHLAFLLSRYKFCAKMLAGKGNILEVGCGDGFGMPVVSQAVTSVYGIDFEPLIVADAQARFVREKTAGCECACHDITQAALAARFDGAYCLDVIEHIPPSRETAFMENICRSLVPHGVLILGTPNREAGRHASPASVAGHINLKDADGLDALLRKYFHNVFIFSMNDEVVHTGYAPMAHYLFGMGVGQK